MKGIAVIALTGGEEVEDYTDPHPDSLAVDPLCAERAALLAAVARRAGQLEDTNSG